MKYRSQIRLVFALCTILSFLRAHADAATWRRDGVLGAVEPAQYFIHPSAICTDSHGVVYVLDCDAAEGRGFAGLCCDNGNRRHCGLAAV
jgi:hypothetical protein